MAYDIEKEVNNLLHTIKANIPRDKNGYVDFNFLDMYQNFCTLNHATMLSLSKKEAQTEISRLWNEERERVCQEEMLDENSSEEEICYARNKMVRPSKVLELTNRCNLLDAINKHWNFIQNGTPPHVLEKLNECLRIALAIAPLDCNLFEKQIKAIHDSIYRAASAQFDAELEPDAPVQAPEPEAEEEKPAPAPQVQKKPASAQKRGKNWPEDEVFYFEQCYRIFQTSSNRNKKGHRLGPFKIYDEEGRLVTTIPAGQGDVKAVFAYVEENISMLSKGKFVRVPKAAQRQYYNWEKEQTQRF